MLKIDMWYGHNYKEVDAIDIIFYPNSGEYRGNVYKDGKFIGDYTCNNSVELKNKFSQLEFNWD